MAQRDYQDWGNSLGNIDVMMLTIESADGKKKSSKKPTFSQQGLENMPDFPLVDIYVPDDHKEMATADGNWWLRPKSTLNNIIQTFKIQLFNQK